jgi:hypothetical protein
MDFLHWDKASIGATQLFGLPEVSPKKAELKQQSATEKEKAGSPITAEIWEGNAIAFFLAPTLP